MDQYICVALKKNMCYLFQMQLYSVYVHYGNINYTVMQILQFDQSIC